MFQARQLHKKLSPEIAAMRRVTGLTDLGQSRMDNINNGDTGEIIFTRKTPQELVGEIYLLQEQLQAISAENKKLLDRLPPSGAGPNSSEMLEKDVTTKRKYGGSFLKKRFTMKKPRGSIFETLASNDFDTIVDDSNSNEMGD